MKLKKISAPSLKELFVKEIENKILSGEIPIGASLPSERELSETTGVSRVVVRAGLTELSEKGFIEIKPRSGSIVADYRRKGTLETLVSIMKYNGGMLPYNDIRSIIEIRLALEKLMLHDLIPTITDEELKEIKDLLTKLKNSRSIETIIENTFNFQHELMVLSGNTLLPLIYYSFRIPIYSLWNRYLNLYGKDSLYENARTLYGFIEARNLSGALKWSEKYITESITGDREIYKPTKDNQINER